MENKTRPLSSLKGGAKSAKASIRKSMEQEAKEEAKDLSVKIDNTLKAVGDIIQAHNAGIRQLQVTNKLLEYALDKAMNAIFDTFKEEEIDQEEIQMYIPITGHFFWFVKEDKPVIIKTLASRYSIDRTSVSGVIKIVPTDAEKEVGGTIHMIQENVLEKKKDDNQIYEELYKKMRSTTKESSDK
jgi:hypothetical protein